MKIHSIAMAASVLASAHAAPACAQDAKLNDFLVDLSAGHVAAFQIINLDKSAVTDLQTPKDLVAALQAAGDTDSKAGFGIAFSPGRSAFTPLAVPVKDYADTKKPLARLWGSTTFSYAQNRKTLGSVDYAQNALAVHVSYYLDADQDPVVAGYNAVVKEDGVCKAALVDAREGIKADNRSLIQRVKDKERELGRKLTDDERTRIEQEVLAGTRTTVSLQALAACAQNYVDTAKKKWNASHVDLVFGQGWIKASGAERLSLGRHTAIAVAWGPRGLDNSLFNLTLRRVDRELDLDTIATSPAYIRTHTAGARYTHGYGEGRRSYLLAEISNVKSGTPTLGNAAFRQALGFDYKLAEGIWLELRAGRALTSDGKKTENKALFNLKFSPETTLAKDAKRG